MQELHTITIKPSVIDQQLVHTISKTLAEGGLVLFPTETTYGAGVDATNPAAVQKLLAYKARREGKPLSIAVTNQAMAEQYVELNDQARQLYRQFLPGPVTVVSQSKGVVAEGVASEFGTLGVRIPDYPWVLAMIEALGRPITATSANASGEKRPYTVADILAGLSEKQKSLIDLIVDAGELPHNPPSTVIDTTLSTPVVFRQGEVTVTAPTTTDQQSTVLTSASEQETRDIAKRILLKYWNQVKTTGVVIGLNGSLGMGKTIFTKGIAEFLQISETISSPTYTYIEEYDFTRHGYTGKLFHLDVWKVNSAEELSRLEIESLLQPGQVIVIEWYSQVSPWLQPVLDHHHLPLINISFEEQANLRTLHIQEPLTT
jgi:L-threonylcarbamoyladenylate synthase